MSKGLFLTIGELSRLTGVGISTLRSWGDKYGLLSPARSGGGFRLYPRADVERVLALKKALYVDGTPPALLQVSPEPPEPPPAPRYPATPTGASEAPEPAGSSRCHREASRETGNERLRGQLRAIRRMAAGLTHPLETGQAIEQTLVLAGSLFDADGSVVLLTGTGLAAADSPLIKYSMGTGPTQLTGADMAIHERVSRSGTTLVIPELRALGGNGSHPSDGARSLLAMPLRYADKNLGVVFVAWNRPHFFTDEEVELGTTLGALAACSIENAALFESAREAERRRGLLQEANAELARRGEAASVANELASVLSESLDMDEVLQLAVKAIVKVTGIEMAIISLLDEGTGGLVVGAHCNVPAALVEEVRHIKLGEGISGRVALTGEAIVAAADDPRSVAIIPFASRLRNRHFACVPLWSRSKVIGTVMITSKRLQPITGEEVQLFTTIGRLTGGAVERARAHERSVRSYYDRLVLMRDELRLMSSVRTQERLRIATELRHYVLERDLEGVGSMFEPNRGVAARVPAPGAGGG